MKEEVNGPPRRCAKRGIIPLTKAVRLRAGKRQAEPQKTVLRLPLTGFAEPRCCLSVYRVG